MEGSLLLYGFQFASSSKGTKAVSRSLISCFVLIAALRSHFQFVFLSFFFFLYKFNPGVTVCLLCAANTGDLYLKGKSIPIF